jgi:hypothetical protein
MVGVDAPATGPSLEEPASAAEVPASAAGAPARATASLTGATVVPPNPRERGSRASPI